MADSQSYRCTLVHCADVAAAASLQPLPWHRASPESTDQYGSMIHYTAGPRVAWHCSSVEYVAHEVFLLAAADVYRPAAIEQLEILGKSIDVEVFSMGTDADPADIAKEAVKKAREEGYDTVLVDTAGRQVVDEDLMEELRRIKKTGEFFCIIIL